MTNKVENLKVLPNNLNFIIFNGSGILTQKLKILNRTNMAVTYKMRTNIPFKYHLSQTNGKINANDTIHIVVTLIISSIGYACTPLDYLYITFYDAESKHVMEHKMVYMQVICEMSNLAGCENLLSKSPLCQPRDSQFSYAVHSPCINQPPSTVVQCKHCVANPCQCMILLDDNPTLTNIKKPNKEHLIPDNPCCENNPNPATCHKPNNKQKTKQRKNHHCPKCNDNSSQESSSMSHQIISMLKERRWVFNILIVTILLLCVIIVLSSELKRKSCDWLFFRFIPVYIGTIPIEFQYIAWFLLVVISGGFVINVLIRSIQGFRN